MGLRHLIPQIDNLPECIRIVWLGFEWLIPKVK